MASSEEEAALLNRLWTFWENKQLAACVQCQTRLSSLEGKVGEVSTHLASWGGGKAVAAWFVTTAIALAGTAVALVVAFKR